MPNPASSTANPNPLTEPSNPSLTGSPAQSDSEDYDWLYELEGHDAIHRLLDTPMSPGHGLDHELSSSAAGARPWDDERGTSASAKPNIVNSQSESVDETVGPELAVAGVIRGDSAGLRVLPNVVWI